MGAYLIDFLDQYKIGTTYFAGNITRQSYFPNQSLTLLIYVFALEIGLDRMRKECKHFNK